MVSVGSVDVMIVWNVLLGCLFLLELGCVVGWFVSHVETEVSNGEGVLFAVGYVWCSRRGGDVKGSRSAGVQPPSKG